MCDAAGESLKSARRPETALTAMGKGQPAGELEADVIQHI
jgi:hypothetical protein